MPSSREGQFTILPEEQYQPTLERIPLSSIDGDSLEPSDRFVESIRALGLIQPIAVVMQPRNRFRLIAGRRRVGALRQLAMERDTEGDPEVPALVFPRGTPRHVASAMSISENVQRSANPLTDLVAIEEMVRAGASEQDIADQLHLPIGTIRSRMRLAALSPTLRAGLESGQIAPGVAERIARLDATRMQAMERVLSEHGRITSSDVSDALRVQAGAVINEMPDSLFEIESDGLSGTETQDIGVAAGFAPQSELVPLPSLDESGLPSEQSWNGVLRAVQRAEQLLPAPENGDDENIAAWLADIIVLVQARVTATAGAGNAA
jgi:ParB-like chromosome segregation protein Spo0J